MKALAINGSPHKEGSTFAALSIVTAELEKEGIETEIFHIGSGPIQGCTACGACRKTGKCAFDGGVSLCAEKLREANGVILGSPTYYGGIAGDAKSFCDRLFFHGRGLIRGKVGAAVTVARRSGGEDTFHQLNSYLTLGGAVIAPTNYWNYIHGHNGEEILRDGEGVCILQTVGRTMAWLIKCLEATKDTIPVPSMEKDAVTNFIR